MKQYDEVINEIKIILQKYELGHIEIVYILKKMLGAKDEYS